MTLLFARKFPALLLAGRRPGKTRAPRPLKACVYKLDGIGDFILALGAIRQILAHYGEEQCALVVAAASAKLARLEFPRATVFGFNQYMGGFKSILSLYFGQAAELGGFSFETLISLRNQRTTFHHLSISWIDAAHSVGFENIAEFRETDRMVYQFPFTETLPLPMRAPAGCCRELERHRTMLQHILKREVPLAEVLPHFASFTPKPGGDLIVTPYGGSPIRDYPEEKLVGVLGEFSRAVTAPIRLCGGPAEQPRLGRLQRALQSRGVNTISVAPPKSIVDFARQVAEARAVLTVETSTAHLAAAFDKPAVVLIGGGHYGQFAPWQRSSKQNWLTHELPCFGCNWRCIYPEVRCISEIPSASVARALLAAWRGQ